MLRLSLLLITTLCLQTVDAQQPLRITWTSVADGQSSVPRQDSLIVEFDRPLAFFTQFNRVSIEPRTSVFRRYSFYDGARRMTFALNHVSGSDFSIVAYGLRGRDGSRMARPFVVNYTTALSTGSNMVSGVVRYSDRRIVTLPESVTQMATSVLSTLPDPSKHASFTTETWAGDSPFQRENTSESFSPDRTVVFLLDQFELEPMRWRTRSAAPVDDAGSFIVDRVRSGSPFPMAMTFGDPDGQSVSAFGFHDPAGMLSPTSIIVDGRAEGVVLTSYPLASATALDGLAIADARSSVEISDAYLVEVETPALAVDGTSTAWNYRYRNEEGGWVALSLNPIFLEVATGFGSDLLAVPRAQLLDTPQIINSAEEHGGSAFREHFAPGTVSISAKLSTMLVEEHAEAVAVWSIMYDAGTETASFHFDAANGSVVTPGRTVGSSLRRHPGFHASLPYPNPANGLIHLPVGIDVPGRVTIQVRDILGRIRSSTFDEHVAAGDTTLEVDLSGLPPGAYILVVEYRGQRSSFPVIRLR